MSLKVNLVVLNYNGEDLLRKYLPSIVANAKASVHSCRVTLLDNCSSDGSLSFVKNHFPEVVIFKAKENKVFCSYNEVAHEMDDDILVLLNNDLSLHAGFIDPLVAPFLKDPKTFFVASHGDRAMAKFRWGILSADIHYSGYKRFLNQEGITLSAGVAAFDRKKFIALGGYDELYLPGRYEDVDLCYRGWKRGWKGYYAPESQKFHEGGTSFKRAFSEEEIQTMVFRNSLLFMLNNITSPLLLLRFFALLMLRIIFACFTGKKFVLKGVLKTFERFPMLMKTRNKAKKDFVLSDRRILDTVKHSIQQRLSIKLMKNFVCFLSVHPWIQKIFFKLTFYNLRLVFPLQYLLLRELIQCESVLDLGCGKHSMVPILPESIYTVGVERFEPYYQEALKKGRHDQYVFEDVTRVDFPEKSFDAVVLLDVLEHLPLKEGEVLIQKMKKWAKKKIVVFTPNGFLLQEAYDSNPYMKHESGWTKEELEKRGFSIYGVRGFKFLKRDCDPHDEDKGYWKRFVDLTQIVTYYFPQHAFQLFCVNRLVK